MGPLVILACRNRYGGPAPTIGASNPFLILRRRRLRRPWARHPVQPGVVVCFLSPSTHPAIASTIRTLVRIRGGRGGRGIPQKPPLPRTYFVERNRRKAERTCYPQWRAALKGEEHPTEPTALWTSAEENTCSLGNINPLTKNVFTSPGKPWYLPSHSTDTCTVSPVKLAPSASGGAAPTMPPPAYHPFQMPMVQNSYTKAVEESNMPKPQFNGELESYNKWVEKVQQWFGGL